MRKKGFNESGLFIATWLPTNLDLIYVADMSKTLLKDEFLFKAADIKFSEASEGTFSNYESLNYNYSFSLFGLKHTGEIYCFLDEGKTFMLAFQEATEDTLKNRPGFNLIKQSFRCK